MSDNSREPLDFLVLGHSPEGATGWPHPVSISVHPLGEMTLLNFSKGPHIANVGGQLRVTWVIVDDALKESFAEEFDACDAHWLVPYLARLAAGEGVTEHELIDAYRAKFGRYPKTELSANHTF